MSDLEVIDVDRHCWISGPTPVYFRESLYSWPKVVVHQFCREVYERQQNERGRNVTVEAME
jgi:hypothetical protein